MEHSGIKQPRGFQVGYALSSAMESLPPERKQSDAGSRIRQRSVSGKVTALAGCGQDRARTGRAATEAAGEASSPETAGKGESARASCQGRGGCPRAGPGPGLALGRAETPAPTGTRAPSPHPTSKTGGPLRRTFTAVCCCDGSTCLSSCCPSPTEPRLQRERHPK